MSMKKWIVTAVSVLLLFAMAACGSAAPGPEASEASTLTTAPEEDAEPEQTPAPEWLSADVYEEVKACLFPAEGDQKNVALAQELLLPLLEEGEPEAMYWWAWIYDYEIIDNDGGPEKESFYWYRLSAEQGFAKAFLGVALNGFVESDEQADEMIEKAKEAGLFDQSPEELGPDGCHLLGSYCSSFLQDDASAVEWYQHAADMGCTTAMNYLGWRYYDGRGVAENAGKCEELFRKAADAGYIYGMENLGWLLKNEDPEAAKSWLQKASDAGSASAMNVLGSNFPPGDYYELMYKSATLGCKESMHYIGSMRENGICVTQDYERAMEWYIKAYENGLEEDAAESINRLLSNQQGVNTYFEHYGSLVYPSADRIRK